MRNLFLLSALCVGLSAVGHADSAFFLVNNTYGPLDPISNAPVGEVSGSAVGSVDIDTSTGLVDAVNITVTNLGVNYLFTGAQSGQSIDPSGTMYVYYNFDQTGDVLVLDFPTSSLVGYTGSTLCTTSTLCPGSSFGYFGLADGVTNFGALAGSLVPTPEPSSLMLLGTGLLATMGAARRRLFSRGV